ncbi:MAG: hypothetical protein MUE46_07100 [Xanthomonadales bacterium]|nr:hypothetical protein [Xanthomonadales bacterium]
MSLLKSLEAEAERLRQQRAAETQALDLRQQEYERQLLPAMRRLHAWLEHLCAQLSAVNADCRLAHPVPDYGTLHARVIHRYTVRLDERVRATELTLEAEAEILTPQCPEVQIEGLARVRQLMSLFEQAGVNAFHQGRRDVRGQWVEARFKPRGRLPLKLTLLAEPTAEELRLSTCGFESLALIRKPLPTEPFDEDLFERIGRYIACQDHDLTREQLPDAFRNSLQRKVQQEALRRRWEEQLIQQQLREEEAERRAIEEQKLLHRARRMVQQWQDRIRSDPRLLQLLARLRRKS